MMKNYTLLLLAFAFSAISYSQTCPTLPSTGGNPKENKVLFYSDAVNIVCSSLPNTIDIDGITFTYKNCTSGGGGAIAVYEQLTGEVIDPNNFTVTWTGTDPLLVCTYVGGVLGNDSFDIENTISISPNPVTNRDYFNIQLKNNMSGSYTLYNSLGQESISNTINNSDFVRVDTSNLSQGIYILNIQVDGKSMTRKIIIDN